jgi:hypothetical protein
MGLAIALIGAGASAGFDNTKLVTLRMDEPVSGMGYSILFDEIVDTEKGFDCHVEFKSESGSFTAVLPHEFPSNAEGVMKRPHVENFVSHDFYIAPNSFQPPQADPAGQLSLAKEETATIGPYEVYFEDFEISGYGDEGMVVAALLTISKDGKSEKVSPQLIADGFQIEDGPARFDADAGRVTIEGLLPEEESVILRFDGPFIPSEAGSPAILVLELSKKPLIVLFWLGTILMFLGGLWSMSVRRRRINAIQTADTIESTVNRVLAT